MEALAQEIASGDPIGRLGPPELYGAVGVAMFKAALGGLPTDQKINAVGNAAFTALTRPTADLGEDGELVEALRKRAAWQRENLGDMLDHGTPYPELEQAADRLILYREALGDAFGTLHYIFETSDDDQTSRAAAEARDKIDAVLRSGG